MDKSWTIRFDQAIGVRIGLGGICLAKFACEIGVGSFVRVAELRANQPSDQTDELGGRRIFKYAGNISISTGSLPA